MLKLIIIDDEIEQVRGISTIIPWGLYDIQVCATAMDGLDGLAKISEFQPDLAIVDIHMPKLSGLELIAKIREAKQDIQIIILTGYDDFSYTQRAIRLAVSNYLLKPSSAEEILQAVLVAKNQVLEQRDLREERRKYREVSAENFKLNRERFLTSLVENRLRNKATFFTDEATYGLHLPNLPCRAAVIRIDLPTEDDVSEPADSGSDESGLVNSGSDESGPVDREQVDIFYLQLENLIEHMTYSEPLEIFRKEDDLVLLCTEQAPSDADEGMGSKDSAGSAVDPAGGSVGGSVCGSKETFASFVERINRSVLETLSFTITTGIGLPASSPLKVHQSFRQALAALENSLFFGKEKVSVFDDRLLAGNFDLLYPAREERNLFTLLALGDRKRVEHEFKSFFQLLGQYPLTEELVKNTGLSLIKQLLLFRQDNLPATAACTEALNSRIDKLIEARTLSELEVTLSEIFGSILNSIDQHPAANIYVRAAVQYIEANYRDPINLQTAATELNLSPTYLSFLFKQGTGVNFIDYLNHYRIDKAKALLTDRGQRTSDVAYRVGLQDEKYFFKLFKRYTGLTPTQYRDSMHLFDSVPDYVPD